MSNRAEDQPPPSPPFEKAFRPERCPLTSRLTIAALLLPAFSSLALAQSRPVAASVQLNGDAAARSTVVYDDDVEALGDDATVEPPEVEPAPVGDTADRAAAAAEDDGGDEAEAEDALADGPIASDELRYTRDLTDEELVRRWTQDPSSLGSVALGYADLGRLVNGERMPEGPHWTLVDPAQSFGTAETVRYLADAISAVARQYPGTLPLRVNDLSRQGGGWLRPPRSHQGGRDVDLAFYDKGGQHPGRVRDRRGAMDIPRNWALIKALVTETDLQFVLVDRSIQRELYRYALSIGEDTEWLDKVFHAGQASLVKHARRHRDHFHVRFYSPRAQELGRRLWPHLAGQHEEPRYASYRVGRRDTLARIARRFHVSVDSLARLNGLKKRAVARGQSIQVPVNNAGLFSRPVPPPLRVPPRCLPPDRKNDA